ncbi:MAG: hypothetical protein HC866_21455 [Leptolyngbyaceae cyanobacterium RU_5_1]|nr:hypothetical protein [Leptolyngbyaceae cyanobacterium RU_5_1]
MHSVLYSRLQAIRQALVAAHQDGGSSAVSGYVREQTIRQLILPSLPVKYRSTTGQIIDQYGEKTGQLDVIVENGAFPSIAAPSIADVRLVLAEGVSSVIEIKSTLPSQWDQVLSTRDKVYTIRRRYRIESITRGQVPEQIPLFVIAYQGWNQLETLRSKIGEKGIDGILVLQPLPLFAGRLYDNVCTATEENALWAFICALHFLATQILDATCDLFAYGRGITEH